MALEPDQEVTVKDAGHPVPLRGIVVAVEPKRVKVRVTHPFNTIKWVPAHRVEPT